MTSAIDITPQMLNDGATSCTNTAEQIDGELASLRSYVVGLGEQWLGVSSVQFQNLMADYDRYGRMLHEALTGIAGGLRGNFHNYASTESTNEATMVSVNGTIPGINLG